MEPKYVKNLMIVSFLIWIFEMFSKYYINNELIKITSPVHLWLIAGFGWMIFYFALIKKTNR